MRFLFIAMAVALIAGRGVPVRAGEYDLKSDREALDCERMIRLMGDWDVSRLRELAHLLPSLPDSAASQALWFVAAAPERLDTSIFFVAALTSPSPVVRRQAADILVGAGTPDGLRLVGSMLDSEGDEATVRHIVSGFARRPLRSAVPLLMGLIQRSGARQILVAAAAGELRRLTRANLPDQPGPWRDWWLDNNRLYE